MAFLYDFFAKSKDGTIPFKISRAYYRIKKLICKLLSNKEKLGVNIGGGIFAKRNWLVLDFVEKHYKHDNFFIDVNFNLLSKNQFPFKDSSIDMFYCSYTLEHIPDENMPHILREIYRCLKPGRPLRFITPDIDLAYQAYRDNNINFFIYWEGLNIEEKFSDFFATALKEKVDIKEFRYNFNKLPKEDFLEFYRKKIDCSSQVKFPGNHINWFSYDKLKRVLKEVGFKNIYRSFPQGSKFREMRGKDFDTTYPKIGLFVEAVK